MLEGVLYHLILLFWTRGLAFIERILNHSIKETGLTILNGCRLMPTSRFVRKTIS